MATVEKAPRLDRLASLEPHEAVAVLAVFGGEIVSALQQLERRFNEFEVLVDAVLVAARQKHIQQAGEAFYADCDPENKAYLARLVEYVKGESERPPTDMLEHLRRKAGDDA